ncbi:tetratricopeptide repeat protein, partial [Microcoleus sp. herbarium12]
MNQQHQQDNQEYLAFLGEILQATSDSNGDAKIIYPILAANQDKLNRTLVAQYQNWANHILSQVAPEQTRNIAVDFVSFSNRIQQFPKGNRASNLDIAIIGYELALTIFTRADFAEYWAMTQNNLGEAYRNKITGNRGENLDEAIRCYQQALEIFT